MKRIIIIRALFFIAFVVIMLFASKLLSLKTMHGSSQCSAMYVQPRDTIDVVMMGSSHVHCDINPAILWKEQGIAAYDFSAAEQPLWITYYYLKEICKYQTPKVVVLDLYSPAKYGDSFNSDWIGENLYNIRPSLNKVNMIAATCTLEQINSFFPAFFGYHWRYPDLDQNDIQTLLHPREQENFKGFTPFYNVKSGMKPAIGITERKEIPERSREYLEKIIDYTCSNDINLLLVINPYPSTEEQEMVYNSIRDLADERDISFVNFNYYNAEIGIDPSTDYSDESHLNYNGSSKFSSYLGSILTDMFDIPDRRGDVNYSSWERNASLMEYDSIVQ